MRICFDGPIQFGHFSGPSTFATRLATELVRLGHQIVNNVDQHDVFLSFIEAYKPAAPRAKKILRLDGIEFKPENFEQNNRMIKNSYFAYEYIIFQSEFDKKMIEKHFGPRSDCSVIGNGIDLNVKVEPFEHQEFIMGNMEVPPKIFVCSSQWHPQKRLKDNIKLFHRIKNQLDGNAFLFILGGGRPDFQSIPKEQLSNVVYVGQVSHNDCLKWYKTADCFIHLAFLDHAPNVCIEALSQDCPIIYASDGGGMKELVKENGYEIKSSKEYDYSLIDYDNPEKEGYVLDIDSFVLPENLITSTNKEYIDIKRIAEKYIEVFNV